MDAFVPPGWMLLGIFAIGGIVILVSELIKRKRENK